MFYHQNHRVRFYHCRQGGDFSHDVMDKFPHAQAVTICRVFNDDKETVGEGVAVCDARDNFDRKIGRKLSLGRALTDAKFPKEVRGEFWNAYFERLGVSYGQ